MNTRLIPASLKVTSLFSPGWSIDRGRVDGTRGWVRLEIPDALCGTQ